MLITVKELNGLSELEIKQIKEAYATAYNVVTPLKEIFGSRLKSVKASDIWLDIPSAEQFNYVGKINTHTIEVEPIQ